MEKIFNDFDIITLKRSIEYGILLKARKPKNWTPANLDNVALYSVLLGRRTKEIISIEDIPLARRCVFKFLSSKVRWLMPGALMRILEKTFAR
jgi:hypothetical protein